MSKRICLALIPLAAGLMSLCAQAQELPYKDGPVLDVTSIRVQDGKFFEYWDFLQTKWKSLMEEEKKQGLVLSYNVYSAVPHSPQDPNLILVVSYPNFAALDGLMAKESAIEQRLFGASPQKSEEMSGQRAPLRVILGDDYLQELQFKK